MKICRLVVLLVQVTTYPLTHKLYISTYTQRYTHTELHTITHTHTYYSIAHTHSAHTHEDMFRQTHTRVTQYIEEGGTRQELGELRVTAKSVVESRVSESLFIYMYFVLYDGGSNL